MRHFVEKAVTAGGTLSIRVTPRERDDEGARQSRRVTDAAAAANRATKRAE